MYSASDDFIIKDVEKKNIEIYFDGRCCAEFRTHCVRCILSGQSNYGPDLARACNQSSSRCSDRAVHRPFRPQESWDQPRGYSSRTRACSGFCTGPIQCWYTSWHGCAREAGMGCRNQRDTSRLSKHGKDPCLYL